ncbi:MAG: ATP-binding cassette domain-containing protein [Lachnospiraceae bacterium]|nr:ATP-binding cassette domain-containing protein [Lachnospiraceae bacterium]
MNDLKKFKDIWKKMMYVLTREQKRTGVVVFFLTLIGAVAELMGVSIILPYAQFMVAPDELLSNRLVGGVCQSLGIDDKGTLIILLTAIVILVYIIKNVFLAFLAWFRVKYATDVEKEMSIRMINSYMNRGYDFFRRTNIAVLLRGSSYSVAAVYETINCFFRILAEILTITCIFAFVAITDIMIALTMVCIAAITLVFIMIVFRNRVQKAGRVFFEKQEITNQWLHQMFEGIKEVLVMNKQKFFVQNYDKAFGEQQRASITRTTAQVYPSYYVEGICITGLMIALYFKITGMENPAMYMAQLASYAVAIFRVLPSIGRVSAAFNSLVFQIPMINEVYTNCYEAQRCQAVNGKDPFGTQYYGDDADDEHIPVFSDEIRINDLSFRYPDGTNNVLDSINLCIRKGDSVALVGPSGAGKSTLADIILGLLKPQTGAVYMDGIDVASSPAMWSRNVAFVPQSVYLLDDTIRRNVAFGFGDDEISDDDVWRALEQAQMREYIESLPDGLDTEVGERGVRFSGGQAQRIAIARALFTDPQILVLDEATSALDNATESAIMDAVNSLKGQKTMIIIAHRLTTVKDCNHIYEIRDGHAVEKKYEELK